MLFKLLHNIYKAEDFNKTLGTTILKKGEQFTCYTQSPI